MVGAWRWIAWLCKNEFGDLGHTIETMSDVFDQRERELRQCAMLLSLHARLSSTLNDASGLREVSERALRLLADALGAFAGALFVTGDEGGGRLIAEAWFGPMRTDLIVRGVTPGEGLLGSVAHSRTGYFIRPAPEHAPRFESASADQVARAYLAYPVTHGAKLLGVLELTCAEAPDESLVAHLEALLAQVGLALANALTLRERDKLLERVASEVDEVAARGATLREQAAKLDAQARELARKNDELKAASAMKSQFIATMSHELRTPLNSILGFTELLLNRSATLSPDDRRAVEEVRSAGRHLLSLINDILDLARIGAGRLVLRRTTIAPASIAREVIEVLRPQAESKSLLLELELDPMLTVDADPSRLRQILLNLVGNAVKFTDMGSVTVRGRAEGDFVRIDVVDTGPGIASADRDKLFREFSRLESTGARRHEGTGLGLAIARQLVLAQGGEIGVDSEPGRGSVFWFTLPRAKPDARASTALPFAATSTSDTPVAASAAPAARPAITARVSLSTPPIAAKPGPTNERRILLVEDHPRNARLIEEMLAPEGYRIEHVDEGLRAIERAIADPPALVLLDLELPGIDGFEVARRLRREARTALVPIVAVTARALPVDEARARAIGCDDFITKPVDMARLRASVASLLGRRRESGR